MNISTETDDGQAYPAIIPSSALVVVIVIIVVTVDINVGAEVMTSY